MKKFLVVIALSVGLVQLMHHLPVYALESFAHSDNELSNKILLDATSFNLIQRLNDTVDRDIFARINVATMKVLRFVPIAVKEDNLFVAIGSNKYIEEVSEICNMVYGNQVKFMPLPEDGMLDLLLDLLCEN